MQADSEKLRQAWIKAVQNSIATAFRDKGDDSEVKNRDSVDSFSNSHELERNKSMNKPCFET